MTHLGEGTLQEMLDGELPPGARAEAEAHLTSCAACAGELAELRGLTERTSALLGLVEAAPPVLAAQARFARHRRSGGAMVQARRALPRAAALVLLLAGAAAAAAVPGSPVREWVSGLAAPGRTAQEAPVQPALTPAAAEEAAPEMAPKAVSILPADGRVRVAVSGSSPELRVRARLVPEAKAEVTATGAAATARFRTGPGRIEVLGAGPGELVVTLPADAEAAFVEVNGRVYAAKEGGRLRSLAPRVAGSAEEPVFRAGSN